MGGLLEWAGPLAPVAGLAVDVLASVALFRLGGRLLRALVLAAALGGLAALGLLARAWPALGADELDRAATAIASLLAYGALTYGYFHFVNLGETARRVRLLVELRSGPPEGLAQAELLARYDARSIVDARLGRLLRSGQVRRDDAGRLRIGVPGLLWSARLIVGLKLLFLGRRGEQLDAGA